MVAGKEVKACPYYGVRRALPAAQASESGCGNVNKGICRDEKVHKQGIILCLKTD